jgi:non-homologous end joining protein Ku
VDLMEALKASVAQAKERRGANSKGGDSNRQAVSAS